MQKGLSTEPLDYYATEAGKALYLERERKRTRRKHHEKEEEADEDFKIKKPELSPVTEKTESDTSDTSEITINQT